MQLPVCTRDNLFLHPSTCLCLKVVLWGCLLCILPPTAVQLCPTPLPPTGFPPWGGGGRGDALRCSGHWQWEDCVREVGLQSRGPAPCPRQGGSSPTESKGRFPGWLGLATALVVYCALTDHPKLNGLNNNRLLGSRINPLAKVLGEGSSVQRGISQGDSSGGWRIGCQNLAPRLVLTVAGGSVSDGHGLWIFSTWVSPCGLDFCTAWWLGPKGVSKEGDQGRGNVTVMITLP